MVKGAVDEAIEEISRGRMVIVVDDEARENEGDLVMAAGSVTPEAVNFMATHGRGLVCVALTTDRFEALRIAMMVSDNTSSHQTAFGVSVDLKIPGHTGISAFDRSATVRALCDPDTVPGDLARPGHIFPLRAVDGGVLRRAGHTEAAVDLARLAGHEPAGMLCEIPAGMLCEIMDTEGSMARMPQLVALAEREDLRIVSVADLIAYRSRNERLIRRSAAADLPTRDGVFRVITYESLVGDRQYIALVMGEFDTDQPVLVRVHSQCLTGDIFGSTRCDCGDQLREACRRIAAEGRGVVLYIAEHEGRGIGIVHKIRAYSLQDAGRDTVEANADLGFSPDLRDYGVGAQVLVDLGVRSVRLMTNNPEKYAALEGHGLRIVERVPLEVASHPANRRYLETKRDKLGHLIMVSEDEAGASGATDLADGASN